MRLQMRYRWQFVVERNEIRVTHENDQKFEKNNTIGRVNDNLNGLVKQITTL